MRLESIDSQFSPIFVSYYSKLGFKLFSTRNVIRNICEDRKKKAFNNRLYKNIKTFRKQPFGNFSAFHSSTIPHFTSTIGRGLKLRRNSTSMRAHVLFSVFLSLCYDCSTSVINALIDFTSCFLRRKWENTLNLRINPVNLRLLYLRNSGEFGRLNDRYIC